MTVAPSPRPSRLREAAGVLSLMAVALSAAERPRELLGQELPGTQAIRSQVVASGTDAVLQAVSPVSGGVVWVSGHEGVILRSLDGGLTWVAVPPPAGDTLQFRDVKAFSREEAVVLSAGTGSLSRIYRTGNAGRSWSTSFLMEHPKGFLDCLDFWDGRRGFAYGDAIDGHPYVLLTEDGGRSWRRAPVQGLPAARGGEGGFAASGTCAVAGEGGRGWIATGAEGSARVLRTTDHGSSWSASDLPLARGPMAGAFTIAVHAGEPIMILGGDLGREEEVVA
ncbi:MAG: oxidoreductase, partial [Gemmatimonadota bacterium]|nr:oxidoreductase [Gemmatimonadota bacterium]